MGYKTLREAKDKVARERGYESWPHFLMENHRTPELYVAMNQAAGKYGDARHRDGWEKGAQAQKKLYDDALYFNADVPLAPYQP